jgi:hypothetical protein
MTGHSRWVTTRHQQPLTIDAVQRALEQPPPRFPAGDTEYEVEILRRRIQVYRNLFWQIYVLTGSDPDMDNPDGPCPPAGVYTPDLPELALDAVRELRQDYDAALDEANAAPRTAFIERIR